MVLQAWRLIKPKYIQNAFSGQGAAENGGRWNYEGVPLVYTASSASLALLELLVNLKSADLLNKYLLIPMEFEQKFAIEITEQELPAGWRIDPSRSRQIGTEWVKGNETAALIVPSAVLPIEKNILFNPRHQDFSKMVREAD